MSLLAASFSNIGNILSGVLIVVSVAAAAWGALNRENLRIVRESNADLIQRVSILEDAEKRLTAEATAAEIRHTTAEAVLTQENETLRSVITNEVHLVAIETLVESHHGSAELWWAEMRTLLNAIKNALEGRDR